MLTYTTEHQLLRQKQDIDWWDNSAHDHTHIQSIHFIAFNHLPDRTWSPVVYDEATFLTLSLTKVVSDCSRSWLTACKAIVTGVRVSWVWVKQTSGNSVNFCAAVRERLNRTTFAWLLNKHYELASKNHAHTHTHTQEGSRKVASVLTAQCDTQNWLALTVRSRTKKQRSSSMFRSCLWLAEFRVCLVCRQSSSRPSGSNLPSNEMSFLLTSQVDGKLQVHVSPTNCSQK